MMVTDNSPWANYRQGWQTFLKHWKVALVVYVMNILLAFVAMGPLSKAVGRALEYSPLQEQFVSSFNHTLIMDFLHQYGYSIDLSINVIGSFMVLYLLWSIFYTGGYMGIIKNRENQQTGQHFWSGGARYFFKFMRLTLYTLAFIGAILFILGIIFSMGGTSPLVLDSEEALMGKLKYLVAIFIIIMFLIGVFKDVAKVKIADTESRFIDKANIAALRSVFNKHRLLLGFINVLFLILGGLLYLLLKKITGNFLIPTILISQLFLLYRIAYKFVRLASFYQQEKIKC